MTGEITLRGQVLPIGGLKEKLLAAQRGGIKNVIIPAENERDLKEIPDNVKENLTIYPLKWMDDVLEIALERLPGPAAVSAVGDGSESARAATPEAAGEVAEATKNRPGPEGELPISPH